MTVDSEPKCLSNEELMHLFSCPGCMTGVLCLTGSKKTTPTVRYKFQCKQCGAAGYAGWDGEENTPGSKFKIFVMIPMKRKLAGWPSSGERTAARPAHRTNHPACVEETKA